jgi:hypothetical protein
MSSKTIVLLSLSAILLGSAGQAIPAYPAPLVHFPASFGSPRRISPGQIYTSPNHTFTIVAPKCNPSAYSCPGWEVVYESEKGTHEMVTFTMPIAGQTYRAGIIEMGRTTIDLDALAKIAAVSRKHQVGVPFDFVEETKVNTQFGEGLLRVYSMKGGSLNKSGPLGSKAQYRDCYIAVLMIPQENRTLFGVSQDDNLARLEKNAEGSWKKSLMDEVQPFFATMTVGG